MKNIFPIKKVQKQLTYLKNNPEKIQEFSSENIKKSFYEDVYVEVNDKFFKNYKTRKTAKEWANDYLNSEEGKIKTEKLHKEAIDYILTGKPTSCLNEKLLDEMKAYFNK